MREYPEYPRVRPSVPLPAHARNGVRYVLGIASTLYPFVRA